MEDFICGIALPLLLFAASALNWSIISFVDLLIALLVLLTGSCCLKHIVTSWNIAMLSLGVILLHALFYVIMAIEGDNLSITGAWWANVFSFMSDKSDSSGVVYFLLIHAVVAMIAMFQMHKKKNSSDSSREFHLQNLDMSFKSKDVFHFRVKCYLLFPIVQLVLGISYPSWVSLPYFLCTCIGLVKWSMKRNYLGLFWCWKYLLVYAGFNIIFLYVYQLPFEFSTAFMQSANLIGLYKFSVESDWPEICSGLSLIIFYFMISRVRCDLIVTSEIVPNTQSSLIEQLLPRTHSLGFHHLRSNVMHTDRMKSEAIWWKFTINFFTYGFPVSR